MPFPPHAQDSGYPFIIEGKTVNFRGTLTLRYVLWEATSLFILHFESAEPVWQLIQICKQRYMIACIVECFDSTSLMQYQFQVCTHGTHASHTKDLEGPLHDHIAITYGITDNLILNSCRYFHVVDGLVPDIMHDRNHSSDSQASNALPHPR